MVFNGRKVESGESTFTGWHYTEIDTRNREMFHKLIDEDAVRVSRLNSRIWHISFKGCEIVTALDMAYIITERKRLHERGHNPIIVIYVSDKAERLFEGLGRLNEYFIFRKADENMYEVDKELRREKLAA